MSMGSQSFLAIDTALPLDGSSLPLEFTSESLVKTGTIVDTAGMRGTRQHASERTRAGNYSVAGQLELFPSPEEWAYLLPWITGDASSPHTPQETIPERYVGIDRVAKCFTYDGVKVARATFSASEGEPLKCVLDLVGKTETVSNAGSFSSMAKPAAGGAPFLFTDGVFTMQSSARSVKEFSFTIDNGLVVEFNNSVSASRLTASDLMVDVSLTTPYTSGETDLHDQTLAGAAATFVFTHTVGSYSLGITLATLQVPAASPQINGRGEEVLRINGVARKASTTDAYSIALDSTP